MENNEIISRIKLMMNYDSKKTLSENREILNEDLNDVFAKILSDASAGTGTNPAEIIGVLKQIKNMTQFLDVEKKFVQRYPYKNEGIYGFSDMINKEMESDNYDDVQEIAKELRRIGYKVYYSNTVANGKTTTGTYKPGSFVMSSAYVPQTQKQTQTNLKGNAGKPEFNWTTAPTIEEAKNGKYIRYGMSGDSVVEIQTKLNEKGGYNLETKTKKFGTNTKNALIDFQKKNNITPAQGIFGPKTWRILFGPSSIESMSTKPLDLSNNPLPSNIEEPQLQTNVGTISNTTTSTDNNRSGVISQKKLNQRTR